MALFSPLIPGEWMQDSIAMQGASMVWPVVFNFLTSNGWSDPSQFSPSQFG
jgi:hypothetical protein